MQFLFCSNSEYTRYMIWYYRDSLELKMYFCGGQLVDQVNDSLRTNDCGVASQKAFYLSFPVEIRFQVLFSGQLLKNSCQHIAWGVNGTFSIRRNF